MTNYTAIYVVLNALINVPMVGFFNKEIDFLTSESDAGVDEPDLPDETFEQKRERKRKMLHDTFLLIKNLIKNNNLILLIFLIVSAIMVNLKLGGEHIWTLNEVFLTSADKGYYANVVCHLVIIYIFQ